MLWRLGRVGCGQSGASPHTHTRVPPAAAHAGEPAGPRSGKGRARRLSATRADAQCLGQARDHEKIRTREGAQCLGQAHGRDKAPPWSASRGRRFRFLTRIRPQWCSPARLWRTCSSLVLEAAAAPMQGQQPHAGPRCSARVDGQVSSALPLKGS